jgi:Glycosyltransferases involved in cell wall biogenesis
MLSIVIPTYNRAGLLRQCIDSVLQQQVGEVELIVVDDGSSDATGNLLEEMNRKHAAIRITRNPGNFGVNYSRNRGIELATQPFIVFLDSDDQLRGGSLIRIVSTIHENPGARHFLFWVSDREAECRKAEYARQVPYEAWVRGAIKGDFIHVVAADVMKKFLFFERFRMYEYLNWLRVFKATAPQILADFVVADRERNRPDCLTNAAKLQDLSMIKNKFDSQQLYYTLYHEDLRYFQSKALSKKLLAVIVLGVACNKRKACYRLLKYGNRMYIRLAGSFILLIPSAMARWFITTWSAIK